MPDDHLSPDARATAVPLTIEQAQALKDLADDILAGKRIARLARQMWPWLGALAFLIWALVQAKGHGFTGAK